MSLLSVNLQTFFMVYEKGSVTIAASKLRVGQTAVTQRIRSLENELGVSLFTRSRKGMELTPEGQSLLKYCLRAKELEGQALSELVHSGSSNQVDLRFAGPTSFMSGRAIPKCLEVIKKWRQLNLHFIIDDRENRLELLKLGVADIVALAPHQVPLELDSKLLRADEYLLLGHPSWKKRDLKDILENERLFAFHENDSTSLNYLKAFDLLRFLRRPRLFVNENLALSTLLRAGSGFGLLSKEIAGPILERGELIKLNQGRSMKDAIALAWYPRAQMPAYLREITQSIK